jgi:hypothetical protein
MLSVGDKITVCFSDGVFTIAEVWSDKEVLAEGGLIIQVSDVTSILTDEGPMPDLSDDGFWDDRAD